MMVKNDTKKNWYLVFQKNTNLLRLVYVADAYNNVVKDYLKQDFIVMKLNKKSSAYQYIKK